MEGEEEFYQHYNDVQCLFPKAYLLLVFKSLARL